ncbi:MAG: small subunit ribosomal protein [Patescibacteria group bacterium]|jgi:small subunit ribosomal protein S11|nr:small subunit ribosomal protein [Patescibacteria group bacterium]
MGKKRIVTTGDSASDTEKKASQVSAVSKKKADTGMLFVQSTYNNTKIVLTDQKGNVLATSSSGSIGFKGAKKGTPFAAAKVGEIIGGKASTMGMREVAVVVKGVGSGRESGIRGFISKGINITSIKDVTAVPHNGPKPKKPRRV